MAYQDDFRNKVLEALKARNLAVDISDQETQKAIVEGYFKNEIIPITIQDRKGITTIIENDEEPFNVSFDKIPNLKLTDIAPNKSVDTKSEKKKDKEMADVSDAELVNENRWLELKREATTPQQKINRGISNINKQLAEVEKFLEWYGKIKNESGVTNEQFWKRTNNNIYSIKERLIKLEQKLRKISE